MAFRDDILPVLDELRAVPDEFGHGLFTVTVVVRTWSGGRVGLGTKADATTALHTAAGTGTVKVRQLTEKDVFASGGLYSSQDFSIGPLTPQYAGGGYLPSAFDPPVGGSPTEVFFKITGPGFPAAGAYFQKIGQDVSRTYRYTFILRKVATQP